MSLNKNHEVLLKYDIHGRLLNGTLLQQKIGVRTMRVRFFGESMQNEISRST